MESSDYQERRKDNDTCMMALAVVHEVLFGSISKALFIMTYKEDLK